MKRNSKVVGKRRGVAMLLVMLGLVVCTLLTAGFLSTQGTSIGIAHNERDAEQSRMLAQAGIDMCYAQIRQLDAARTSADQPSWREKMSPGTWLNNYAVGKGTVTVKAASADGASSFSADPHQSVILTSTGTCSARNFTLTGTIGPTGGGEVFRGGNFFQGNVIVGSGGLPLLAPIALVDSYNSASGPYSTSGTKAVVWTNSTQGGAVTVNTNSVLDGPIVGGVGALLSSVLNLLGGLLGSGGTVTAAQEVRDPGFVLTPNLTGLSSISTLTYTTGSPPTGLYNTLNLNFHSPSAISLQSGTYAVTGDLVVQGSTKVSVPGNTVIYVGGNFTMGSSSAITVGTAGSLTIYVAGNTTISAATISASGSNPLPSQVQILGLPSAGNIQITGASKVVGVLYSPKSSVTMQTGTPQVFGAVVAHDMTLLNTAQFHYDEATKTVKLSNISGGTAPPGAADYTTHVVEAH